MHVRILCCFFPVKSEIQWGGVGVATDWEVGRGRELRPKKLEVSTHLILWTEE